MRYREYWTNQGLGVNGTVQVHPEKKEVAFSPGGVGTNVVWVATTWIGYLAEFSSKTEAIGYPLSTYEVDHK